MRFFNIVTEITDNPFCKDDIKRSDERELAGIICKNTMAYMEEVAEKSGCVFMSATVKPCLTVCTRSDKVDENALADTFMKRLGYTYSFRGAKEVSIGVFFDDLTRAGRNGLITDESDVVAYFDLEELYDIKNRHYVPFCDRIADDDKSESVIFAEAKENYLGKRYESELHRIFGGKNVERFIGIPAHYIIGSASAAHRRTMIRNIVSALYRKSRLLSRRYTIVELNEGEDVLKILPDIYTINEGATVLLKIESDDVDEDGFKRNSFDIDAVCDIVKANCSRVLTVFSIDSRYEKVKEKIRNELSGLTLVDISEDIYAKNEAVAVLRNLAQKDGVELARSIEEKLLYTDRSYDFNTLSFIYDKWRHEYLSTTAFPEYSSFFTRETEEKEKISDAYAELQSMIGLDSVKKLTDEAIRYFKLQKEYRRRGIQCRRPCMHMVFTGSPGTAKTTVARLLARIFKDNDILSVGNLFEVGRGDIIGQYVGHTAPLVKSVFKKAKGSVLFIDEAYSLVDDRRGMYGDEAINTIVQEMENNRDDLIVIFAGYKEEMKDFLHRNPGLNSRIAFHVPFDDYSCAELCEITKRLAQKSGFTIEADAEEKLRSVFDTAKRDPTFGNGRFARNLFEKAKLSLSERIGGTDLRFVSDRDLTMLTAADFAFPDAPSSCRKIGFAG